VGKTKTIYCGYGAVHPNERYLKELLKMVVLLNKYLP